MNGDGVKKVEYANGNGSGPWDVWYRNSLGCLIQGLCPLCENKLGPGGLCAAAGHRLVRWHYCDPRPETGAIVNQLFLDVARRGEPETCPGCGFQVWP